MNTKVSVALRNSTSHSSAVAHTTNGRTVRFVHRGHRRWVYGQPEALDTRKRAIMTGLIVLAVVIALIAGLGVVAVRERRTVGPEAPDQWKIERDAMRDEDPGEGPAEIPGGDGPYFL
jgi:hypothetical protein